MSEKPILSVRNLKTYFDVTKGLFSKKQIVKAVDDVSFDVMPNETFGLVGESGCGKTTLGRTIVKLYDPVEGSIEFLGKDIANLKGAELKAYRKDMQMIFGFSTPQAIYKWIHGDSMPTIDNLVILASILNVTIDKVIIVCGGESYETRNY